jgi:hypothetical protein
MGLGFDPYIRIEVQVRHVHEQYPPGRRPEDGDLDLARRARLNDPVVGQVLPDRGFDDSQVALAGRLLIAVEAQGRQEDDLPLAHGYLVDGRSG